MPAISNRTFNALDRIYFIKCKKIINKTLPNDKASKLFCHLSLNKQDVKALSLPCLFKTFSQYRFGRLAIRIFYKKLAVRIIEDVVKNYQAAKLGMLKKRLKNKNPYNPTKKEQKKIIFLAIHSQSKLKIQTKLRKRAWKRWRNSDLPRKLFEQAFPKNVDNWTVLLSDKKVDACLAKVMKEKLNYSLSPQTFDADDLVIRNELTLTSDNINSTIESVPCGDKDLDKSEESDNIETPFDYFEHSQTLPYYLSSAENFLAYLLDSKEQKHLIDRISLMAASYTANNAKAKHLKFKKYNNIFHEWAKTFAVARKHSLIISKEQYLIDFAQFPKIKPLVPLLRYLPVAIECYQKWQNLGSSARVKVNYHALSLILKNQPHKRTNADQEIAELLMMLMSQFIDRMLDAWKDEQQRQEWLKFCKKAAGDWEHPFYAIVMKVSGIMPESAIRFSIKQTISDYIPMLSSLNRKIELLHKYGQDLMEEIEEAISKEKAAVAKLKSLSNIESEESGKQIKESEEYIELLIEYKEKIEENKQESLRQFHEQIKWESTPEAKLLDQRVADIHRDIFKELLFAWLDKHSLKPWIACLVSYRHLILYLHDVFRQESLSVSDQTNVQNLVADLIINGLKAFEIYFEETPDKSVEKAFLSAMSTHLKTVSYKQGSQNLTLPTWQQLLAPMLEELLQVPGLFGGSFT